MIRVASVILVLLFAALAVAVERPNAVMIMTADLVESTFGNVPGGAKYQTCIAGRWEKKAE